MRSAKDGAYDLQYHNCEHFVTGCKGVLGGYGWSCQVGSKGTKGYGDISFPTQEIGWQEGDNETVHEFAMNPVGEGENVDDEPDYEPPNYDESIYPTQS